MRIKELGNRKFFGSKRVLRQRKTLFLCRLFYRNFTKGILTELGDCNKVSVLTIIILTRDRSTGFWQEAWTWEGMDMERQTDFDTGRTPLGFELREIHNLIKMMLHKMRPPCKRPGTPLTQLQGGILGYLYHHDPAEPVYQKNIEEAFRISRATATNTLQVMERNGLITRKSQDQDARLKRIFMTEEACREHTQMEKQMEELDAQMLAGMSDEEAEQFLTLLDRVRDNLKRINAAYDDLKKQEDQSKCVDQSRQEDQPSGDRQRHNSQHTKREA